MHMSETPDTVYSSSSAEEMRSSPLNAAAVAYYANPTDATMTEVIRAGEGLVRKFARVYGGGCSTDDLFQAGCEGILKAIGSFERGRGVSFVTYASHVIIGEIRHMVRKEMSYYRPGCIEGLQSRIYQVIEDYSSDNGVPPDKEYIADQLNVRAESVDEVLKAGLVSMDDLDVGAIKSTSYETFQLPLEDRIFLEQSFKKLTALQKKVIKLLFYTDLTQTQVAKRLGLTQRQVSRIKEKSIDELKKDTVGKNS